MSFFSVKDLCASYGANRVLDHVSFSLERGEVMGVLGSNGCGKTTLLKAICGILPYEGACTLDSTDLKTLSPRRLARLIGYIPQRSGVTIDISALDVVLMGFNPHLGLLEQPTAAMRDQAMAALFKVGLGGKELKNYQHLSEGQKQLCILARTLVSCGSLLLLDEPESALDFRFRHDMLALLRDAAADCARSVLVALHDPQLALNSCDRLLLLCGGRVLGVVSPAADPIEETEQALSHLYGPVSLHRVSSRRGKTQLVMLKEEAP